MGVDKMRLAVTGFVSEQAGSVASANALLLRALLQRGHEMTFFSKASFVDPRPAVAGLPGFEFVDVDNKLTDRFRAKVQRIPLLGPAARMADASAYNRLLVRQVEEAHRQRPYDLCLWLGDYARGRVSGIPTVSFVQGAPGSDARSLIRRFDEIARLNGAATAWKWRLLAQLRLSPIGLPPFHNADHFIVGSSQSKRTLHGLFGVPDAAISSLPYPIDLKLFKPAVEATPEAPGLRILWLGRVVPRKRLDLFLNGAAEAIRRGVDVRLTVIGGIGFLRGYSQLLEQFPYPDRLTWQKFLAREHVPAAMREHDLLAQPSEEEDFGSSVAEAQACGLPVIVGQTNGNADYIGPRDIHLADYEMGTYADALQELAGRKTSGQWGQAANSRGVAEQQFAIERVADRLEEILKGALKRS